MMSKSLNYAYPQKYAEGGPVAERKTYTNTAGKSRTSIDPSLDGRPTVRFTDTDPDSNKVNYTLFTPEGNVQQFGTTERQYANDQFFGANTTENYNILNIPAGRPSDDAMLAALQNAGAEITYNTPPAPDTPVFSLPPGVDPMYPAPPPPPPEPETPTASGSGSGLVDPETPTGYQSSDASAFAGERNVDEAVLEIRKMIMGLNDKDLRYDANNDGKIELSDALSFLKYSEQENYNDDSGFMAGFYGQGNGSENLEDVVAPPEQKSLNYAFVDADGNSYNMGDVRPGHDGTSLERAIANVQEYYDFAPGSFTVSVPSEERLVGTYDSDSGSFQAATSDMRDLNGFSALPGEGLMPPPNTEVTTAAMGEEDTPFLEPTQEEMIDFFDLPRPPNPTYTDQIPGYTEDGVEFQGPDMPPSQPEGPGIPATTRMVGEEEGMDWFDTRATTMAMGEEDGGGLMPPPGGGPGEGQLTTLMKGEEDGGGLMPPPGGGMVTTQAMGEEDGGGLMPPPGEGQLTTMAMGEEEGEGLMPDPPRPPNPFLDLEVMPDFIDPMIPEGPGYTPPTDIPFTDIPPVVVPPNTGYTFPVAPDAGSFLDFYNNQPPVNAPVFSPGPVAPPVYQPPTQGRTYGASSGTPRGPTNSIQPFTPYMPPQQAQDADLQSLISDTDYFLNNSAPRTSVFKRS